MITQINTANSVYELDADNSRIRRVSGNSDPTPRFGENYSWRTYDDIFLTEWNSLAIRWEGHNFTMTSSIVSVSVLND